MQTHGRQEFVTPKTVGMGESGRNSTDFLRAVSPLLMPRMGDVHLVDGNDEDNQHGLRRRSSQIISADASFNDKLPHQGRDREDSISAFKKVFFSNDINQ